MRDALVKLNAEKFALEKLLAEVDHKIKSIERTKTAYKQAICEHDFQYEGHGHNDDLYKCKKCNKTKWE